MTEDSTWTYAYDARGNRVSRTAKATGAVETYAYDSENRLTGYVSPTATATYAYDAIERRVAKTVDGDTTAFLHDYAEPNTMEPSHIVMEFSAAQDLNSRWVFGSSVDEPLSFESYAGTSMPGTGVVQELFGDRQGSIRQAVNTATAAIESEYSYDGYGAPVMTAGTSAPRYGFRGREFDAESRLYHQRWRTYDPQSGSFLQMDPLGFGGGQENLYAFVDNDPFNLSDPLGLTAYSEYRSQQHLGKQSLGSATRAVSSGVFRAVQNMVNTMGDFRNYSLGTQYTSQIGSGTGNNVSGNCGTSELEQHVYAIYDGNTGKNLKIGVGNDLIKKGQLVQSKRAMRQIPGIVAKVGHGNVAHVVLIVIPTGFMARGQALILEKMIVQTLGMGPFQSLPTDGPFGNKTPSISPNC